MIERRTEFWSRAIKDFRRKYNLTQEEFAYGCGLTRTAVVFIENRYNKRVQKITAEALAKYMNIEAKL